MDKINKLIWKMIEFDYSEPELIQHFLKVHSFVKLISSAESLSADEAETAAAAAVVHDIGIKIACKKFGHSNGKLQEQEGPAAAEKLLAECSFSPQTICRVSYLVAHHHTYSDIKGLDYQILVEADFLVNLYENHNDAKAVQQAYERIFKTATGKKLCKQLFGI